MQVHGIHSPVEESVDIYRCSHAVGLGCGQAFFFRTRADIVAIYRSALDASNVEKAFQSTIVDIYNSINFRDASNSVAASREFDILVSDEETRVMRSDKVCLLPKHISDELLGTEVTH